MFDYMALSGQGGSGAPVPALLGELGLPIASGLTASMLGRGGSSGMNLNTPGRTIRSKPRPRGGRKPGANDFG